MTEKIIASAFLIVAATFAFIALDPLGVVDFDFRHGLSRKSSFSDQISEDLYFMKKKSLLPPEWESIQYIAYNFHSDFQRKLVGHQKFDIKEDPQGKYRLEIEFIDLPDEKDPGVILQMSLIDIVSNNKIFEIGRTHSVVPFLRQGKKKEDHPKTEAQSSSAALKPMPKHPAATSNHIEEQRTKSQSTSKH